MLRAKGRGRLQKERVSSPEARIQKTDPHPRERFITEIAPHNGSNRKHSCPHGFPWKHIPTSPREVHLHSRGMWNILQTDARIACALDGSVGEKEGLSLPNPFLSPVNHRSAVPPGSPHFQITYVALSVATQDSRSTPCSVASPPMV